ncbi:dGTP triphosphohydrolase [Porphyromonas sp.]|uniref:dGTP triphosphohydrolase n=1 Tax=Porphyromonas sp. TaxID=1924944 RepID=UPI0026DDBF32|nr:dNTP triphosphohydrolase [Porphyromonas sp.]MDO4771477.1 dNTP triphosphohydrolase [Porphyromonas sp.]
MDWHKLISDRRFGLEHYESKESTRTDFQRDYDRLIFSAPFRRLQNKTQVFPLPGTIFVHNRLTHSLEVSCIGRSLGTQVGRSVKERHPDLEADFSDFGAIVSAACLAHDMGNPPFGHAGERAITAYFTEGKGRKWEAAVRAEGCRWEDFAQFEGNANAIRLLTHAFKGRRDGGFVLTYSTLASIVKYPYTSLYNGKKFGFFETEEESYAKIADHLGLLKLSAEGEPPVYARHPLVYLVEAADDICYQIMDIEDAFKLKILSYDETTGLLFGFFDAERRAALDKILAKVQDINERIAYLRSSAIGVLVDACVDCFLDHEDEILSGTFDGTLVGNLPDPLCFAYEDCRTVAFGRIYNAKEVLDIELAGFRIFEYLLETLIDAQLNPDHAYSKLWFNRIPPQYELERTSLYGKIQTALDYISGMTDVYALDVYRKFTGMSLPAV